MKKFDLEQRTFTFDINVRNFIRKAPKSLVTMEDLKQLMRSSGSIGANYIEANEALGRKDFYHKIRICRKESRETTYWLGLLGKQINDEHEHSRNESIQESTELAKMFGSILKKNISKEF